MNGWLSPRLGIRFEVKEDWLHIFGADGQEFLMSRERARRQHEAIEKSKQATAKLAAKLRELGVDPDKL
jgi:hypothetical protein